MFALSLATLLLALPSPAPNSAAEPAPVRVGYVYGSIVGIDFSLYTHLCHAFLTADSQGQLDHDPSVPSPKLARDAHQHGVQVLLSLGGWGWDEQFASIVQNPDAEDRYLQAVLQAVETADYDGIDLDWEYPDSPREIPGFERLVRRLRQRLDLHASRVHRPMLLTMAASSNEGTLRWLDRDLLLESLDWINVMTYDMAGDWTPYAGHHAPLFPSTRQPEGKPRSVQRAIEYLLVDRRFPPDRIALGIPLYGRGFAVQQPYASTQGAPRLPRGESGGYAQLAKLIDEGWIREWDDETKTPWLRAPDGHAVIGYDDAQSVAAKARFARQHHLRGVFYWQVAGDRLPDGSHPLQEAVRDQLSSPSPPGQLPGGQPPGRR